MVNVMDAFSQDINKCLFQYWTPYVGKKNPHPGLSTSVKCKGRGLCYGLDQNEIAQYGACYDQVTLIPVFTGHIVHPNIGEGGGGREDTFRADTTIGNSNQSTNQSIDSLINQSGFFCLFICLLFIPSTSIQRCLLSYFSRSSSN